MSPGSLDNGQVATSLSAVEASQPERLVSAAAEVGARTAQLDSLITAQRASVDKLREGWSGTAANAALARGERNLATQEALRDKLRTLQGVLATGGGQLGATRTALLDMVSQLKGQGWRISDNGVATPPPNLPEVFRSYPQAYTRMLQRLLKTYDGIDGETARKFPTFDEDGAAKPDVSFAVGDDPRKEEIEDLVRRSLAGDKDAARQVDDILDGIEPNQLQPHSDPNNPGVTMPPVPLTPDQAEVVSQMQSQMSGKSLDELVALKNDLGEHGDIIGDSMQVMSDPDVKFPLVVDEPFKNQIPPGIDTDAMTGGKGMLPQSVKDALDAPAVSRAIAGPDQTIPVTTYPSGDDLQKVSELIRAGDAQFQQGSELDRTMMDRAVDVLHGAEKENRDYFKSSNPQGDSIVQDIFNSAGRDQIVSHDMITEPNSTFLDDIARHEWTDNGAAIRTLTDWVHDGATSTDPDVALRAGETANALSTYLGDSGDDLLNLQHPGGWGLDEDTTVGQMNPDLVQSWGDALDPYQKAMLGDGQMPGFEPVPGTADSDFTQMRNIFAVMDSDPTAAKAWNEAAYEHILDYQRNPDYNNLANAGAMLGVVDSAAVQEMESRGANNLDNQKAVYDMKKAALGAALGWPASQIPAVGGTIAELTIKGMLGSEPTLESVTSNAPTTNVADAMNQTNFYIAEGLVRDDPNLGEMSQYVNPEDGSLKRPEDIPASQRRDYFLDMQEYVENRGFANAMDTFYKQYQEAGGINVPKGFVLRG
ncbi:hypothetical protein MMOR_03980 [Mycolicibacterium moriokaense]|uniref:TPR repeat domain-containing protein n=1 Tax=Mycolicibacterium moriokaense TaxID=39691 RepID=A0AAD1M3T9_9MYCO|nr:hypothetical protein MMOR_03980 [Mycolicibacterium moriokaense]